MNTHFGILFSVKVAHSYYSGTCDDFEYLIPSDSAVLLRNRRIIFRMRNGACYFFGEKDETNVPIVPVTGITLRLGLRLTNPNFSNFTNLNLRSGATPLYRNLATPGALDAPVETVLTGALFSYPLTKTGRPVTVTVKDGNNNLVQTTTVTDPSDSTPVSVDLTGHPSGLYSLNEKLGGSTKKSAYYVDPELARQAIFGILEIKIGEDFPFATPPELVLNFSAREETLKFYVVGKNYTSTELNLLTVTDAGYNEESRPRIQFTRVSQGAFTATDISPSLLAGSGSRVVLFKSQNPVARREKARRKIQLGKNPDVLIRHLPSPSAGQPNSDIIVQISKP